MAIGGVIDLGKRLKDKLKSLEISTTADAKSEPSKPSCVVFFAKHAGPSLTPRFPRLHFHNWGYDWRRRLELSSAELVLYLENLKAESAARGEGVDGTGEGATVIAHSVRSSIFGLLETILTCELCRWEDLSHYTPWPAPPTRPSSAASSLPERPFKAASTSSPPFVAETASASIARSAVPPSSSVRCLSETRPTALTSSFSNAILLLLPPPLEPMLRNSQRRGITRRLLLPSSLVGLQHLARRLGPPRPGRRSKAASPS